MVAQFLSSISSSVLSQLLAFQSAPINEPRREFLVSTGIALTALATGCSTPMTDTASSYTPLTGAFTRSPATNLNTKALNPSALFRSGDSLSVISSLGLQGDGNNGIQNDINDNQTYFETNDPEHTNRLMGNATRFTTGALAVVGTLQGPDGLLAGSVLYINDNPFKISQNRLLSAVAADENMVGLYTTESQTFIAQDPETGLDISFAGSSKLVIRDLDRPENTLLEPNLPGTNATSIGVLRDGSVLALSAGNAINQSMFLSKVDPSTGHVETLTSFPQGVTGQLTNEITLSSDEQYAYIGTSGDLGGTFYKVNTASGSIARSSSITSYLESMNLGRAIQKGYHVASLIHDGVLFVADFNNKVVVAIDPVTMDIVNHVETGIHMGAMSVDEATGEIVVVGQGQQVRLAFN